MTIFVASEIHRHSTYGARHPLSAPRVSATVDLCRALGWLPEGAYVEAVPAGESEAARYHDRDYLRALREAEERGAVSDEVRARFGIGTNDNPVFPEIYRRPMANAGAALRAAAWTRAGGAAFCPGSGTHHARPGRAAGFCYLNDPVLAILAWRDAGVGRVAYVDIDAHHGDGVEAAFADDQEVLTISVHEAGRWPRTGVASDPARSVYNFPVPAGCCDTEFRHVLHAAVVPLVIRHRPDAVFLQAGADGLLEDPLSRLALSNNAHREALALLRAVAPRLIVTGGGGYHPVAVARCWSLLWADLAGFEVPEVLPAAAEAVLRALPLPRGARDGVLPEAVYRTMRDPPREGTVRDEVATRVRAACGVWV